LNKKIYLDPPIDPTHNQAEEFRIIGLHSVSPVFWGPEASPGIDQDNTNIFLGVEWWTNDTYYMRVTRYRRDYQYNPVWETIWSSPGDSVTYHPNIRPRHIVFATQRSNHADAGVSGPVVVAWAASGYAQFWPDDTDPSSNTTVAMPGDASDINNVDRLVSPDSLVAHQGRIIIMPLTLNAFGDKSVLAHNECMYWTAYNDLRQIDFPLAPNLFFNVTVGPEAPVGYGVMASLTANELFLIKCRGGAYIIQGDIGGAGSSAPTSRTLPYVRSPGLAMNNGTYSPNGYLYFADGGGAWLWQGGDFSSHVTKHLQPEFWRPPAQSLDGTENQWGYQWSQCDAANNWVLAPNNWLWDTDLNAWWRADDPDDHVIHRWNVDWRSRFAYGTASGFRNQTDPALYEYDLAAFASDYSWQSQPLTTTIGSSVVLTDVEVVATGRGRVDVTVSSRQSPDGITQSFWSTSDTLPDVQRQTFGVRGTHLTIRIQSYANDPDGAAPTVNEVRYKIQGETPTRR
jgi:hypothetical protein